MSYQRDYPLKQSTSAIMFCLFSNGCHFFLRGIVSPFPPSLHPWPCLPRNKHAKTLMVLYINFQLQGVRLKTM